MNPRAILDSDAPIKERQEALLVIDDALRLGRRASVNCVIRYNVEGSDLSIYISFNGPTKFNIYKGEEFVPTVTLYGKDIDRARAEVMMLVFLGATGDFVRADGDRAILTNVRGWLQS